MARIPLERTIGDTYRFVLRNPLSILGIAWFPVFLLCAASAAIVWWMWPELANAQNGNAPPDAALAAVFVKLGIVFLPYLLLYAVVFSMIGVGLQRTALGLMKRPALIFFSLGSAVWRLIGGTIVAVVVIEIVAALTVAAVFTVFWIGNRFGLPGYYGLVEFAAVVTGIGWFVYMAVRLTFFIAPVVVAEGGIGLERSWQLGAGNFWRMVALYFVCVFAPSIALSTVAEVFTLPMTAIGTEHMEQAARAHQAMSLQQFWSSLGPQLHIAASVFVAFEVLSMLALGALSNAMRAFAYKGIVTPRPA